MTSLAHHDHFEMVEMRMWISTGRNLLECVDCFVFALCGIFLPMNTVCERLGKSKRVYLFFFIEWNLYLRNLFRT